MRRCIDRLKALQGHVLKRDQLLMKLGAARQQAGRAANLVQVSLPKDAAGTASLEVKLDRVKLRRVRRREGHYLLRTNIGTGQPEQLWSFTEVEQRSFRTELVEVPICPVKGFDKLSLNGR